MKNNIEVIILTTHIYYFSLVNIANYIIEA